MLKAIFGNDTTEKVLYSLVKQGNSYGKQLSEFWGISLNMIQKQLNRLEEGGVLSSTTVGRTRLYEINPRYPFKNELILLIDKSFEYLPQELKSKFVIRKRPRRSGKPL